MSKYNWLWPAYTEIMKVGELVLTIPGLLMGLVVMVIPFTLNTLAAKGIWVGSNLLIYFLMVSVSISYDKHIVFKGSRRPLKIMSFSLGYLMAPILVGVFYLFFYLPWWQNSLRVSMKGIEGVYAFVPFFLGGSPIRLGKFTSLCGFVKNRKNMGEI